MKLYFPSIILRIARMLIIPGYVVFGGLLPGCRQQPAHEVTPAFYYWKTQLRLRPAEQLLLQQLQVATIYLRLFDVDWDAASREAVPAGILSADSNTLSGKQVIPVIYITQPCLQQLGKEELPAIAGRIAKLAAQLCDRYHISPSELQVDCDWTRSTAALYFMLLQELKQRPPFLGKQLSCTVRLHQLRYRHTGGAPPVDRGMLMVYNMGNLTRYGGHNSLLDVTEAQSYLRHASLYPLPLDIALPLYHWSVLFEDKKFRGIVYNVSKADFDAESITHLEDNLYRITMPALVRGYRFRPGQEIRFEAVSPDGLEKIAGDIAGKVRHKSLRLAFFHLDSAAMQPYNAGRLQRIIHAF